MQDTSFFARPDSFPAASPVPVQRQQHETDKPDPGPNLLIRRETGLGCVIPVPSPLLVTLRSFVDNEQGGSAGAAGP